jgi:hypothetical protein
MKVKKIKIEHGIPVPFGGKDKIATMLKLMKVGDSFIYPARNRTAVWVAAFRLNMKIVTRTVGNGMIRIWRSE